MKWAERIGNAWALAIWIAAIGLTIVAVIRG